MEQHVKNNLNFSLANRVKSFGHAFRGIRVFVRSTHNSWIHIGILIVAVILGAYFKITGMEWVVVILASGVLLSIEAVNTAIEINMNLTSPEYHPYARNTKDVAAGAVLIAATTAGIVYLCVFGPYIINFLS